MVGNTNFSRESGEPYPALRFATLRGRLCRGPPQFPGIIFLSVPHHSGYYSWVPLLPRLLQLGLQIHGLLFVGLVDGAGYKNSIVTDGAETMEFASYTGHFLGEEFFLEILQI